MSKRIYVVVCEDGEIIEKTLVRANSASQAIRFVADPMFVAHVASQDDLVMLAKTHSVKEA